MQQGCSSRSRRLNQGNDLALIMLSDRPGTADDSATRHTRTLLGVCMSIKKSTRWHVYKSNFKPACVFVRVRRLVAVTADYLGFQVGSLVPMATLALLTLSNLASERDTGLFAGALQEWLGVPLQWRSFTSREFLPFPFDPFSFCYFVFFLCKVAFINGDYY